jgi:hypothetical protein
MVEAISEVGQRLKGLCKEMMGIIHKVEKAYQKKVAKGMPASNPNNMFAAAAIL